MAWAWHPFCRFLRTAFNGSLQEFAGFLVRPNLHYVERNQVYYATEAQLMRLVKVWSEF
jgi:hypothetical protein